MSRRPAVGAFPGGLRLDRGDLADAGWGVVLTGLAVVGFRTAYGGTAYLVVGLAGTVAGTVVGFLLARARLPLLVATAAGIVGFFVVGAVVLRQHAVGGVLPTPATLAALLRGAVNGWADLLTAVAPVGNSRDLLVIPLLCGYVGALATIVLAVLVPRVNACVLPPMGVLAVSVLFGVHEPASLLLQGGVFGAVAIGWMSFRETRRRRALVDTGRVRRQLTGGVLLALSAAGALVLGPNLPLADSRARFVLRDRTEPPFDPSQFASPLVAFRRYVDDKGLALKDKVLLTVAARGGAALPEGARVRLAVMDEYDGVVWAITGRGSAIGGSFERVGDAISTAGSVREGGQALDLTFAIQDLPSALGTRAAVWMPVAGAVGAVQFGGPRQDELSESFRFDRATDAAALPATLKPGDTYRVTTRLSPDPPAAALAGRPPARFTVPPIPDLPGSVREIADKHSEGATDAATKVRKLEEWLRDGSYTDGGEQSTVPPGHSIGRLTQFLRAEQLVGNGEQYAAALALMARALGLPSRVVLGFTVPAGGVGAVTELRGRDVDAWVEIAFDGIGWVGFYPTPDKSHVPSPDTQTKPEAKREEASVDAPPPPPSTIPPPRSEFDDPEASPLKKKNPGVDGSGNGLSGVVVVGASAVGIPSALLALLGGLIVALKARRRRGRRTSGEPAQRIAGAWSELVDNARDLGEPVSQTATRMELTPFLSVPGSVDIARAADAALFGARDPTDVEAEELWRQVDAALAAAVGPLPRPTRLRAAISLTSLRSR